MRKRLRILLGATAVAAAGVCLVWAYLARGVSARDKPLAAEAFVARRLRHLAIPRGARSRSNPAVESLDGLAEARAHFADHCASCHANDGSGRTPMGENLYPKAPDMRLSDTQSLSDGELFSIIQNGVRFTGMPAWGSESPEDEKDSWNLVRFIRHLPKQTPEELEEMKNMNPKTPEEFREDEDVRKFLEGGEPVSTPKPMKH